MLYQILGDNTLINPNSQLYADISELSEGDMVVFSGTFLSDDKDHIEEGSMSESGAMTDPEFLLLFNKVSKYKN